MDTKTKQRGLLLAMGIAIGIVLSFGGAMLWVNFDRISQRFNKLEDMLSSKSTTEQGINTIKRDTVTVVVEKSIGTDTPTQVIQTVTDTIATIDTMYTDSTAFFVRKDELLLSKNIKVIRLDNSGAKAIDTLTAKVAGTEVQTNSTAYKVEFWKSPINYKGYKLGKGRIILFGIYQGDISLLALNNRLYLKDRNFFFTLEPSEDFRTFQPVTDNATLVALGR